MDGFVIIWDDVSGSELLKFDCGAPVLTLTTRPLAEYHYDLYVTLKDDESYVPHHEPHVKVYRLNLTEHAEEGELLMQFSCADQRLVTSYLVVTSDRTRMITGTCEKDEEGYLKSWAVDLTSVSYSLYNTQTNLTINVHVYMGMSSTQYALEHEFVTNIAISDSLHV